jgi:hypothetical protein
VFDQSTTRRDTPDGWTAYVTHVAARSCISVETLGITDTSDGRSSVFLFFSNRLGCLGSLLVSAVLTLLVIGILVLL